MLLMFCLSLQSKLGHYKYIESFVKTMVTTFSWVLGTANQSIEFSTQKVTQGYNSRNLRFLTIKAKCYMIELAGIGMGYIMYDHGGKMCVLRLFVPNNL